MTKRTPSMLRHTQGCVAEFCGPAWSRRRLVVLLPLIVLLLGHFVLFLFDATDQLQVHQRSLRIPGPSDAHRYQVAAAFLLHVSLCYLAVRFSWRLMEHCFCARRVALVFIVVLVFFVVVFVGPEALYARIGAQDVVSATLGSVDWRPAITLPRFIYTLWCVFGLPEDIFANATLLGFMNALIQFVNAIVVLAVVLLGFALSGLVNRTYYESVAEGARLMTRRARDFQRLALLTSGVTVSGVLFMHSWMAWPFAFFMEPSHYADYARVAESVRNYMAVLFVVILAAGFLPTWHWLQANNQEVFRRYDLQGEELWVTENRDVLSRSAYLFVIGGPVFVQIIVKVMASFMSGDAGGAS